VANGGCFVGRDVHSNPGRNTDGAETPSHLNAVGQWLVDNVTNDSGEERGIWCTNCHQQLSQEMWKAENVHNLIEGEGICSAGSNKGQACTADSDCGTGGACALNNVRALPSLPAIAAAIGVTPDQAESWLDPKDNVNGLTPDSTDHTHRIWDPAETDANVATIEVGANAGDCAPLAELFNDALRCVSVRHR